jgi:hypothetical protein
MFRFSRSETDALNRSQSVTGSQKHRDPRFPPSAFTEHGTIMAATVLNGPRAVEMSLYVVPAFVKLREILASNKDLAKRLDELDARLTQKLATHDQAIAGLLNTIRELMKPRAPDVARGRPGRSRAHEPLDFPAAFPRHHRREPAAIPEATAPAGSPAVDAQSEP